MQELFTVERIEDGETLSDPFDYDYSFFTDRETAEEFSGDSAHETHKPCKVVRFIRETPEIALRLNAHEGLVEALRVAREDAQHLLAVSVIASRHPEAKVVLGIPCLCDSPEFHSNACGAFRSMFFAIQFATRAMRTVLAQLEGK
jgi:hypothetical protein